MQVPVANFEGGAPTSRKVALQTKTHHAACSLCKHCPRGGDAHNYQQKDEQAIIDLSRTSLFCAHQNSPCSICLWHMHSSSLQWSHWPPQHSPASSPVPWHKRHQYLRSDQEPEFCQNCSHTLQAIAATAPASMNVRACQCNPYSHVNVGHKNRVRHGVWHRLLVLPFFFTA